MPRPRRRSSTGLRVADDSGVADDASPGRDDATREPIGSCRVPRDIRVLRLFQAAVSALGDGSRATAKERKSRTAAAPIPNKTHCQVAKVGFKYSMMSRQRALGGHWYSLGLSCAVQRPTPIPAGNDATPRINARMRLIQ